METETALSCLISRAKEENRRLTCIIDRQAEEIDELKKALKEASLESPSSSAMHEANELQLQFLKQLVRDLLGDQNFAGYENLSAHRYIELKKRIAEIDSAYRKATAKLGWNRSTLASSKHMVKKSNILYKKYLLTLNRLLTFRGL